jgi:hypothetical protein
MTETQLQIIRQSSAKTAFEFAASKGLKSSDGFTLAKLIEQYVIHGK